MAHPGDCGMYLSAVINHGDALDTLRQLRRLDDKHFLTLMCRDLSELGTFAKVNNTAFRCLKNNTPGLFTFILEATKQTPKKIMHAKHKTIGLRIPEAHWLQSVLCELDRPLVSVSLVGHEDLEEYFDYPSMLEALHGQPDMVIDTGEILLEQTSVVDLTGSQPLVIREGAGQLD